MNVSIKEQNNIITVTPGRTIAYSDIALLRARLLDSIGDRNVSVVLDLKELPVLDTSLLSFIIDLKTRLNGNLALAHVNDMTRELLTMTRLSDAIVVCDSMEAV